MKQQLLRRIKAFAIAVPQILAVSLAVALSASAVQGPAPSGDPAEGKALYPVVVGDYYELYHPSPSVGFYMNDHTVFKTVDKEEWNVIGITSNTSANPQQERHFANGVGTSLAEGKFKDNPATNGIVLDGRHKEEDPTPNPNRDRELCWAPHVIYEERTETYHMFYYTDLSASDQTPGKSDTGHVISKDLVNWKDVADETIIRVPNGQGQLEPGNIEATRDPMVFYYEKEDKYLLYATGVHSNQRHGGVALYESKDLYNWDFVGFALEIGEGAPQIDWSTGESPFLIEKDGKYILSVCVTDCSANTYHDSILFISDDPTNFGIYHGANRLDECPAYLGRIPSHAAEYIYDETNDQWYVTSCGWPGLEKYEGSHGGTAIAKLQWMTKTEYEAHGAQECDHCSTALDNHSFETGNLDRWKTEGSFDNEMVCKADVSLYGNYRDMLGEYTFCSFADDKNGGDNRTGAMVSKIVTLGGDGIVRLNVSGGNDIDHLYVALLDAKTDRILYKATGRNAENSVPVTWDASKYIGKDCYIKVVDSKQGGWGHIGVDCIRIPGTLKDGFPGEITTAGISLGSENSRLLVVDDTDIIKAYLPFGMQAADLHAESKAPTVATVRLNEDLIYIQATGKGKTTITVSNKKNPQMTEEIAVTVVGAEPTELNDCTQNAGITFSDTMQYRNEGWGPDDYGVLEGDHHASNVKGSWAEITFEGTGVDLLGTINYNTSTAVQVELDGKILGVINANSATGDDQIFYGNRSRGVISHLDGLEYGIHTVRYTHLGDLFFTVDAFRVYSDVHHVSDTWSGDETYHWHDCEDCGEQHAKDVHTGGTATCTLKAVCTVCGRQYGRLNPDNHTLIHQKKIPATVYRPGVKEHWKCSACSSMFADAEGKKELTEADLELPELDSVLPDRPHGNVTPNKPEKPVLPFVDVPMNQWYYDSVCIAWENDLIDGMTASEFKPDSPLTVAQAIKLAAVLHQHERMGNVTLTNGSEQWYSTYVNYAIFNGIIEKDYADDTAAQMNAAVSRREFVKILRGAMTTCTAINDVADNVIPDVKMSAENAKEIYEFYRAGILNGYDEEGTFYPESNIKRSEVAAILVRIYDADTRLRQ